jgi:hypothetical protein
MIVLFSLSFLSCAIDSSIQLDKNGGADISLYFSCGDIVESTLRSLFSLESDTKIFDETDIKKSCEQSGFTVKSLSFTGSASMKLVLHTDNLAANFSSIPESIKFEKNSFVMNLNKNVIASIIAILPPESADYLDLLMAPVFSEEEATAEEYIDLISAVYGNNLANEMKNAKINITLSSPTSKKQLFSIPLTDILCAKSHRLSFNW